ncbi:swi5-like zinc finger protein [Mortierella sp. AD094]|nr:swi5-like zinc finger protein [Mortierella sp. AD094]
MQDNQDQHPVSSQERRNRSNEQHRRERHGRIDNDRERDRERDRNRDNESTSPRSSRRRNDQSSRRSPEQQQTPEQREFVFIEEQEQEHEQEQEQKQEHGQDRWQEHDQESKDAGPSELDVQDVTEPQGESEPEIEVVEEISIEMMVPLEAAPTPTFEQNHSDEGSPEDQGSFKKYIDVLIPQSLTEVVSLLPTHQAKEDAQIEELKATILDLQRQEREIIQSIRGEGTPNEIIGRHIKQLHRYNEIKDAGQIILGKCAELDGSTIKKQYELYGLDLED